MKKFYSIVICALWAQVAYGITLISGSDVNSVTVTATNWTATFKTPTITGTQYDTSNQVISGVGNNTLYGTTTYSTDTPLSMSITEDGGGGIHLYVNNQSVFSPNVFRPTTVGNMLEVQLIMNDDYSGGGWSMNNLSVNGHAVSGSWSALSGAGNRGTSTYFYVSDFGSFNEIAWTADLHSNILGGPPGGNDAFVVVSEVTGAVPEPSALLMMFLAGVILLTQKTLRRLIV